MTYLQALEQLKAMDCTYLVMLHYGAQRIPIGEAIALERRKGGFIVEGKALKDPLIFLGKDDA